MARLNNWVLHYQDRQPYILAMYYNYDYLQFNLISQYIFNLIHNIIRIIIIRIYSNY